MVTMGPPGKRGSGPGSSSGADEAVFLSDGLLPVPYPGYRLPWPNIWANGDPILSSVAMTEDGATGQVAPQLAELKPPCN